jgi:hypothetical protein
LFTTTPCIGRDHEPAKSGSKSHAVPEILFNKPSVEKKNIDFPVLEYSIVFTFSYLNVVIA